ncbi:hypothetical protein FRX31_035231 [Thalictrum thalictroides]|uniref:Uncharacterized protein n=1 Tax=Thalictrum thalictroides TaxID=46969 RepID=A0A7J6USE9_THATH|nr:hypothetical protein FRX31_035231 [Thalictrum thalictroides]
METNLKATDAKVNDIADKQTIMKGDLDEIKDQIKVMQDDFTDQIKGMKDEFAVISKGVQTLLGLKAKEELVAEAAELSAGTKTPSPMLHRSTSNNGILGPPPGGTSRFNNGLVTNTQDNSHVGVGFNSAYGNFKVPKIEFPCFEGVDVRGWIRKSNRPEEMSHVIAIDRLQEATLNSISKYSRYSSGPSFTSAGVPSNPSTSKASRLLVNVANGSRIQSDAFCRAFEWIKQ